MDAAEGYVQLALFTGFNLQRAVLAEDFGHHLIAFNIRPISANKLTRTGQIVLSLPFTNSPIFGSIKNAVRTLTTTDKDLGKDLCPCFKLY